MAKLSSRRSPITDAKNWREVARMDDPLEIVIGADIGKEFAEEIRKRKESKSGETEDEDDEDDEDEKDKDDEDEDDEDDDSDGEDQPMATDALDAMEALATQMAAESRGQLTKAQAYARLLAEHPGLYTMYLDERPDMMSSTGDKRAYMKRLKKRFAQMGLGTGD